MGPDNNAILIAAEITLYLESLNKINKEDQNAEVIPTVGDSLAAEAKAIHIGILTKATEIEEAKFPHSKGFPMPTNY